MSSSKWKSSYDERAERHRITGKGISLVEEDQLGFRRCI